jgi:UDP-N-acetylglucosamine transferase subunit ALG13
VIAHGGCGTVDLAVALGKRPIIVPRRKAFGEAPDDHQLLYAKRLDGLGVARLVEDPDAVSEVLNENGPLPRLDDGGLLIRELQTVVTRLVGDAVTSA